MKGSVVKLRRGKFGRVFQEVAENAYFGTDPGWEEYVSAMNDLAVEAVLQGRPPLLSDDVTDTLRCSLSSGDRVQKARAAFVCNWAAFSHLHLAGDHHHPLAVRFQPLREAIGGLLSPDDPPLAPLHTATWRFVWRAPGS